MYKIIDFVELSSVELRSYKKKENEKGGSVDIFIFGSI